MSKDDIGKKMYKYGDFSGGFKANSFKGIVPDEEDFEGTNTMYFRHMHYLNDHCRPSYECWKNNSLGFRIKYRIKHIGGKK